LVHRQVANDTPAFPQQHCGRWNTMPGVITAKLVWSTVREGVIEQRANLCAELSARVNVICLDQLDHRDNSDLSVGSSQCLYTGSAEPCRPPPQDPRPGPGGASVPRGRLGDSASFQNFTPASPMTENPKRSHRAGLFLSTVIASGSPVRFQAASKSLGTSVPILNR